MAPIRVISETNLCKNFIQSRKLVLKCLRTGLFKVPLLTWHAIRWQFGLKPSVQSLQQLEVAQVTSI